MRVLPARAVQPLSAPLDAGPKVDEPIPGPMVVMFAAPDTAATTAEVGHLRLGVKPWADVTVDGTLVGTTPLAPVALAPGTYTARLLHPDYRPVLRKVTIEPGRTTPLQVDLGLDGIRNR
jgi:hypothetical protein